MSSRSSILAAGIVATLTCATPGASQPLCPPTPLWKFDPPVTQAVSGSALGLGLSYYAHGPSLVGVWNDPGSLPTPHVAGQVEFIVSPGAYYHHELGHNLALDHAGPATLANGSQALFVTSDNGHVYKFDPASGALLASADLRRATSSSDRILATPAVQLNSFSNAAFQSAMLASRGHAEDLVIVATYYPDETANQVIALYASDLTERWRFNSTGSASMGSAADGCEIDYATNLVYCGTNATLPGQNSLWAIQTLSGGLKWAVNIGSVQNRPILKSGGSTGTELYVAPTDGTVQRRDPAGGALIWSYADGGITQNIWAEFRDPQPTLLYFTTTAGELNCIQNFPAPVPLWPPLTPGGGVKFTTMPVVNHASGKVYVGRSDGMVQEISTAGTLGPVAPVAEPGDVYDPSFDVSSAQATTFDRLLVTTTSGGLARYCIPWSATTAAPAPPAVTDLFLRQNAPNPFSSDTRVEYRLPSDARVEIGIFDVNGQRVRTLVRAWQQSGPHDVAWDGLDDAGRTLASGLYFYRLRAVDGTGATFERTRKIQALR